LNAFGLSQSERYYDRRYNNKIPQAKRLPAIGPRWQMNSIHPYVSKNPYGELTIE
jgi:hypothetical protein